MTEQKNPVDQYIDLKLKLAATRWPAADKKPQTDEQVEAWREGIKAMEKELIQITKHMTYDQKKKVGLAHPPQMIEGGRGRR